jgi:5-methylcytosine-specific restriction endonuclease McrA
VGLPTFQHAVLSQLAAWDAAWDTARDTARDTAWDTAVSIPTWQTFGPEDKARLLREMVPLPQERDGRDGRDGRPNRAERIDGPVDLIGSYQRAIALVRAQYGADKPAWWCREILILEVRRAWAREDREARTRTDEWDLYARDGFACSNPVCTARSNLHAHHIVFRSHGGSDDPHNRTVLCAGCHRLLHVVRSLGVQGRAPMGLSWRIGDRHCANPCADASCSRSHPSG